MKDCFMKRNVGFIDKAVRIFIGLTIVSLAFFGVANKWFLLGLIPLFTGIIGWCPLYKILGINSLENDKSN